MSGAYTDLRTKLSEAERQRDEALEALRLMTADCRGVWMDEPRERRIPTQHRAGDILSARAVLAKYPSR